MLCQFDEFALPWRAALQNARSHMPDSHSPLEERIFRMYDDAGLGRNPTCGECADSALGFKFSGPVSIWHVGKNFGEDGRSIVFVGKTARGRIDDCEAQGVDDTTSWADLAIRGREPKVRGWAYWAYTRAIIERLYGSLDEGWERVAFTNLVKMQHLPRPSTTPMLS
jgi:hypothetical protein